MHSHAGTCCTLTSVVYVDTLRPTLLCYIKYDSFQFPNLFYGHISRLALIESDVKDLYQGIIPIDYFFFFFFILEKLEKLLSRLELIQTTWSALY